MTKSLKHPPFCSLWLKIAKHLQAVFTDTIFPVFSFLSIFGRSWINKDCFNILVKLLKSWLFFKMTRGVNPWMKQTTKMVYESIITYSFILYPLCPWSGKRFSFYDTAKLPNLKVQENLESVIMSSYLVFSECKSEKYSKNWLRKHS